MEAICMSIGDMREVLVLQKESRTERTDGGYDVTWTDEATVWAASRSTSGREEEQGGRLFGSTTFLFTMHTDDRPADFSTGYRIKWTTNGDLLLNVRAIRYNDSRRLMTDVVAEQGAVI